MAVKLYINMNRNGEKGRGQNKENTKKTKTEGAPNGGEAEN